MQIEGIPDGWELVRIGIPNIGEWIIANDGELHVVSKCVRAYCYPIIRKIEKPKRYRPFANAEEFTPHRNRWWRMKNESTDYCHPPVFYSDNNDWERAFHVLVFDDGTPFGVEVTE